MQMEVGRNLGRAVSSCSKQFIIVSAISLGNHTVLCLHSTICLTVFSSFKHLKKEL